MSQEGSSMIAPTVKYVSQAHSLYAYSEGVSHFHSKSMSNGDSVYEEIASQKDTSLPKFGKSPMYTKTPVANNDEKRFDFPAYTYGKYYKENN